MRNRRSPWSRSFDRCGRRAARQIRYPDVVVVPGETTWFIQRDVDRLCDLVRGLVDSVEGGCRRRIQNESPAKNARFRGAVDGRRRLELVGRLVVESKQGGRRRRCKRVRRWARQMAVSTSTTPTAVQAKVLPRAQKAASSAADSALPRAVESRRQVQCQCQHDQADDGHDCCRLPAISGTTVIRGDPAAAGPVRGNDDDRANRLLVALQLDLPCIDVRDAHRPWRRGE